ncbi:hypothetical protein BDR26DRAFT_884634 [Obelidium mucronatum]|nr:hypothetical protein BDR26DRAFT_884634 [Obelidium mucronatum]
MPPKMATSKSKHTTPAQRKAILAWLEIPSNFRLITGSAAFNQKVVAGAKLKKTDAYKSLAEHVNDVTGAGWTAEQGKTRYEAYLKTYKATKTAATTTGFGITDEDAVAKISTIEEKLEAMCPNYSQLDRLFGERQNIQASATEETDCPINNNANRGSESEDDTSQFEDDALFENDQSTEENIENSVDAELGSGDTSYTSLEDAVNRGNRTPVGMSRKRKTTSTSSNSSTSSLLDGSTLVSNSKAKPTDQFTTADELKLKEKMDGGALELKREELGQLLESRALEREFKERQLQIEEKRLETANELEKQKMKMGLIQAAITSGKTPADLKGFLDLF